MRSGKSPRAPFFGWWVLLAATVGLALGFSNIVVASFGLFVLPLTETFGWGRGDVSVALLLVNCTLAIAAPFCGILVDRFGARRVLLPSIALLALALVGLTQIDGNVASLYAGYVALTLCAIGTIPATYTRVVIAWFDQRRGLAIGISMAGIGIGATLLPPAIQFLMDRYGWRAGYLALAALVLLVSMPVVAALLRERPADLGQTPDGVAPAGRVGDGSDAAGFELRDCMRMRSFWLMAAGFPLLGVFTSGIMAHLVPLLRDRDVSPSLAALGASLLGVMLIMGRVICGALMDRWPAPRVVVGFLAGPVIGLALLAAGANDVLAFVAVALIGLGIGAELDFMSFLVSRYLGPRAYGRTYSLMYSGFAVGAGIGSVLMGYVQQQSGSYESALWILCATTLIAALPFSQLGPYPALPRGGDVPQAVAAVARSA